MALKDYFKKAIDAGASDVHLASGHPPLLRVFDELVPMAKRKLSSKQVTSMIKEAAGADRWKRFQEDLELEFAEQVDDYRFRINVHSDRGNPALAARVIPGKIPSMEDITLPASVQDMVHYPNGLIIVTGPAGVGKSTTLASMINSLNQTEPLHIVTLEDPIEYVYPKGEALVKQREIGLDTHSFQEGLRRALRQDPDVIMVGEMRDPETISTALTLAETGHLVFSTLHTNDAAQSMFRIIDSFDGPEQEQVRHQLSLTLRAVVAQVLLPRKKKGLIAAREVLINTPAIANMIRQNKIEQLKSAIQTGRKDGMITMEKAVDQLLKDGELDEQAAELYLRSIE